MTDHPTLVALLAERSAKRGEFTLASGKRSTFYVDAIGGLTLGADPISYAISYASAQTGHPLRAFTVRKEAKSHGTGKLLEGPFRKGDRVAVIEDVLTTGGSALRAIDAVRVATGTVVGVLALVDREEGGRQAIEQIGVPVVALTTASQIINALPG